MLKNVITRYSRMAIPDSLLAVVDSSNEEVLLHVSRTKLPAVTCGLSPRDTLTLSSIGEQSAVVSLQRAIVCLDGAVCEPQEIPVLLRAPADCFVLMAVAAVFILSGNISRLSGALL